jgi:Exocyst complex component Sec10-like, alpha-helical bundle
MYPEYKEFIDSLGFEKISEKFNTLRSLANIYVVSSDDLAELLRQVGSDSWCVCVCVCMNACVCAYMCTRVRGKEREKERERERVNSREREHG